MQCSSASCSARRMCEDASVMACLLPATQLSLTKPEMSFKVMPSCPPGDLLPQAM